MKPVRSALRSFEQHFTRSTQEGPGRAMRVYLLLATGATMVQAVHTRRLEDILIAVVFAVLFVPSGLAPKAYRARLAALDKHLAPSTIVAFLFMLCWLFVLFAKFLGLNRPTSLYLALPAALVLAAIVAVRQRARIRRLSGQLDTTNSP